MLDVVYIFKESPSNNSQELRYSLRSLANFPFGKVFLAGDKPSWVKNVDYIRVEQNKTKSENWYKNMATVIKSEVLSDDFIMMNDDFFIMKQIKSIPNNHAGLMKEMIHKYESRYPDSSRYIDNMKKLYNLLKKNGCKKPLSYELHTPMILNKRKVADLFEHSKKQRLYQFRSYYGNYHNLGGEKCEDVKIFLEPRHNDQEFNKNPLEYLNRQLFLSTTGGSFNQGLAGKFIKDKFPSKSVFEI